MTRDPKKKMQKKKIGCEGKTGFVLILFIARQWHRKRTRGVKSAQDRWNDSCPSLAAISNFSRMISTLE
jgi:hypothetical protein